MGKKKPVPLAKSIDKIRSLYDQAYALPDGQEKAAVIKRLDVLVDKIERDLDGPRTQQTN